MICIYTCFFYFCSYCPAPESMRFMSLTSSLKRSDSEEQSVHIMVNKCWQHLEIVASLMIHPPRIPRVSKCQGCQTLQWIKWIMEVATDLERVKQKIQNICVQYSSCMDHFYYNLMVFVCHFEPRQPHSSFIILKRVLMMFFKKNSPFVLHRRKSYKFETSLKWHY